MQTLQQKASDWSGVDHADAFAIDETNLFNKLGLQTFIDLSTNFYNRMTKKRSGLDRYSPTPRKRKQSRTSTSSLCRGWAGPLCILRGKVRTPILRFNCCPFSFVSIQLSSFHCL
ncbi:Two-on-two hemoglobin-3 [Linum perenne]